MKLLILHRIPYYKIEYHKGIDHDNHEVYYIGTEERLSDIPSCFRCNKIKINEINNIEKEIIDWIKESNNIFDLVISLSEYQLMTAAKIRESLNIKGPKPNQIEKVRDKLLMKKYIEKEGLKVPSNYSLLTYLNNKSIILKDRIVLKPTDGASSENINTFYSRNKLVDFVDKYISETDYFKYEVEEFIVGDIVHFDGLVKDGNLLVTLGSRYIGDCLSYANKGEPLGSFQIDISAEYEKWIKDVIVALSLKNGSFHLEAFETKDGLVFLEIGNRVGGADVVKTFELATGLHLPSLELKIYLNENITITKKKSKFKYGWFVFPGHNLGSNYCKILIQKRIKEKFDIITWNELPESTLLKKTITYQSHEVPLSGIIRAENSCLLKKNMEEIFNEAVLKEIHE